MVFETSKHYVMCCGTMFPLIAHLPPVVIDGAAVLELATTVLTGEVFMLVLATTVLTEGVMLVVSEAAL